jgi:hypothetical protein
MGHLGTNLFGLLSNLKTFFWSAKRESKTEITRESMLFRHSRMEQVSVPTRKAFEWMNRRV